MMGQYVEPRLYRAVNVRDFRLLFLNALDGEAPGSFDFSSSQMEWLENQLGPNENGTKGP
jgi:hypothetical protein